SCGVTCTSTSRRWGETVTLVGSGRPTARACATTRHTWSGVATVVKSVLGMITPSRPPPLPRRGPPRVRVSRRRRPSPVARRRRDGLGGRPCAVGQACSRVAWPSPPPLDGQSGQAPQRGHGQQSPHQSGGRAGAGLVVAADRTHRVLPFLPGEEESIGVCSLGPPFLGAVNIRGHLVSPLQIRPSRGCSTSSAISSSSLPVAACWAVDAHWWSTPAQA